MAQLLIHAQPGDIITAEDWNLVVDAINELLQAGQTTGIKVAALLPAGTALDPIRIGLLTQITGQNFGFAIGQSKVIFEQLGSQITVNHQNMLSGSSDERLLFIMPAIPGLPADGVTSTMRVNNGVAADTRSVIVRPVVINLQGDVIVTFRGDAPPNPNPNPIVVSQPVSFAYRFQSFTNLAASFDLVADIPAATVAIPAGLVSTIEFRDEGNNVIQNRRIEMGKNETRNITVRIPQVPAAFGAQKFSLRITASSAGVVGSDQREFSVGTIVAEPDPAIEIAQTTHTIFDIPSGNVDSNPLNGQLESGSIVKLKLNKVLHVPFNVTLKQQGTYTITIAPKQGTTLNNWTLQLINTPPSINAPQNDPPRVFTFGVNPNPGAVATGAFVFRIKRTGVATEWSKEFTVQLLT
jgi:hypothetical protein